MASRKMILLGLLMCLSCSWVSKALEGDAKVREDVKDVTIQTQRGGSCDNDPVCRDFCPGCLLTKCIFKQCVCEQCTPPKPKLEAGGQPCEGDDNETCRKYCPGCKIVECFLRQCICTKCSPPHPLLHA
ncbi:unnamed protein product [Eruca vesicaria subsp. sativa]|uniref:Uncharacterized protein n=1 Tax=Eruca vesicaria subsp. sativa TaxID=29727 RepID=A0ABC8KE70_ERUVS|nr:unnamed protein product [Eruca vesicaria subsp. sativa]